METSIDFIGGFKNLAARFNLPGIEFLRLILPVIVEWSDPDYFTVLNIDGRHDSSYRQNDKNR